MAKRRKPTDPQTAHRIKRAADLEAVGMQREAAALDAHQDVEITRLAEERGGKKAGHNVARRMDAFDALKEGMAPGAYDAARRLERDVLEGKGEGDRGRIMERVDCDEGKDRMDLMIEAAARSSAVLDKLAPRDRWLLLELIVVPIDRGGWRGGVAYITGETNFNAQGAAVRAACVNLRDAYEAQNVGDYALCKPTGLAA